MRLVISDLSAAIATQALTADRLGQAYEIRALCWLELAVFVVNQVF